MTRRQAGTNRLPLSGRLCSGSTGVYAEPALPERAQVVAKYKTVADSATRVLSWCWLPHAQREAQREPRILALATRPSPDERPQGSSLIFSGQQGGWL